MTGLGDDQTEIYYGVKNRLLGICYDIRHAFMGDRDIVLEDNGMREDIMKWHEQITPTQNVYYSVEVLFPEAIFVAASVPKMYIFSSVYYGAKGKRTDMDDQLPPIPYSDYIDKCNIELLKTDVEKRKDKLRNIAKRIVKKPQAYMNMEADLRYWAKEYKTTIYELHDPKVEYPDDFEW